MMRHVRLGASIGVAVGMLMVLAASPARADSITYNFTGTITSGGSGSVSGSFTYDTSGDAYDSESVLGGGHYTDYVDSNGGAQVVGWTLVLGGTTYSLGSSAVGHVIVFDDYNQGSAVIDGFGLVAETVGSSPALGLVIDLNRTTSSGQLWSGMAIPSQLVLSDFATRAGTFLAGSTQYQFTVTSLEPVPEPASLALVAAGLLGAAAARRRHRARQVAS